MKLAQFAKERPSQFLKLFLLAGILLNLVQAAFTDILFDEAYYWYFAKDLDWGYFDHPPMMALFIKISGWLLHGELGVRFFAPFLYAGTLWLIWKMINHPQKASYVWLFCTLALATPLFTAYGFFLLPDTPLLFFSAWFLYLFQQFKTRKTFVLSLLMAIAMAAIMYSKYHGILLIGAVILANLSVLKSSKFWLAGILAILLYVPHLHWLYETDFVTLEYHLTQRAKTEFKIGRIFEYLGGQLIVLGLVFVVYYWAWIKSVKQTWFLKTCFWIVTLYLGFFFLNSFNRNAQAQWTIVAIIPLIILCFHFLVNHKNWQPWFYRLATINIFIILYARLALVFPALLPINYEAHGNKEWIAALKEQTEGIPVVFENSYRDASIYQFYTGIPTFSWDNLYYRKSQFDIDSSEYALQHRKVAFVSPWLRENVQFSYQTDYKNRTFNGTIIPDFRSARKLICKMTQDSLTPRLKAKQEFYLINPYAEDYLVRDLQFEGYYTKKNNRVVNKFSIKIDQLAKNPSLKLNAGDSLRLSFSLDALPTSEKATHFRIAIREFGLKSGFQGIPIPLKK